MPDSAKIKECPACKAPFNCDPTDCWCSKLPVIMPMIEDAACYCPGCLDKLISDKLSANQFGP